MSANRRTIESQGFDIETSAGWRTFNRHNTCDLTLVISILIQSKLGVAIVFFMACAMVIAVMINAEIPVNSYSLMDVNGKLFEFKMVEALNFRISVSQCSDGIYFLRLETDDKPIMRKIIVE